MIYFISDIHFGETEDRHKLFYRNRSFPTVKDFDETIIKNWNSIITKKDIVYIIGDFAYSEEGLKNAKQLNGTKILIKGNYDDQFPDEMLLKYFNWVLKDLVYTTSNGIDLYLNHYPINGKKGMLNLTGHIHSLWKVQRNMINVSVECWDYKPVSMDDILFTKNAMEKFYDQNVFAGELECNISKAKKDKDVYISGQEVKTDLRPIYLSRTKASPHWAKAFIYGLHKMDKDFVILNSNEIETNVIKTDIDWQEKYVNITIEKEGIFIMWFDDIDDLEQRICDEGDDLKNAKLIIGSKNMTNEINEKLEKLEKSKDTIVCYSFDEIYKQIKKLL